MSQLELFSLVFAFLALACPLVGSLVDYLTEGRRHNQLFFGSLALFVTFLLVSTVLLSEAQK